jgi:hypothetical protein
MSVGLSVCCAVIVSLFAALSVIENASKFQNLAGRHFLLVKRLENVKQRQPVMEITGIRYF